MNNIMSILLQVEQYNVKCGSGGLPRNSYLDSKYPLNSHNCNSNTNAQ